MKALALTFLVLALVIPRHGSAGKSSLKDPDAEALTILAKNCAGCHQAADHPGALFLNKARLSEPETIALITKLIETEQMPPVHQDFKKSADGKKLLKWLKGKKK